MGSPFWTISGPWLRITPTPCSAYVWSDRRGCDVASNRMYAPSTSSWRFNFADVNASTVRNGQAFCVYLNSFPRATVPANRPSTERQEKTCAMPSWVVTCPDCSHTFTHTPIEAKLMEQAHRDPFRIVPRPQIQADEKRACPGCKKESVYTRSQLFYRM